MPSVPRNILQTVSGQIIDIKSPSPATIDIRDIAHGLSHLCRFAGQTKRFWSVAQHSIAAARLAESRGLNYRQQLYALLHDAAEAYINDLPSPVKSQCTEFGHLEDNLLNCILQKYLGRKGLAKLPKWLKNIDDTLLAKERAMFFDHYFVNSIYQHMYDTPLQTRCDFLNLFNDLMFKLYFGANNGKANILNGSASRSPIRTK